MKSKIITIAANGNTRKNHKAAVIYCTEGPASYELLIKYGEQTSRLIKGWAYPLVDGFEIYNLSAEDQTVEFVYLNPKEAEYFKDTRMIESGPQSILGTVATSNQPLTDDGGSIRQQGGSYKSGNISATSPADETDVVTSAQNTNGVVLRTAHITMTASLGGLGECSLRVHNAGALMLGHILRLAQVDFENMNSEIWIPADHRIFFHTYNATGQFRASYDIL